MEQVLSDEGAWRQARWGRFRVVKGWREVPGAIWKEVFAGQCRDHRYYELTEETLPQEFAYRYALLEREGETVVVPFFLVDQDMVAGVPAPVREVVAKVRKVWPRFLKIGMLMVGSTAGEGQLPASLGSGEWVLEALREAVEDEARRSRVSMVLFKDFPSRYREMLEPLTRHGYFRAPSMPGAAMKLGFSDFDDYMSERLSRIYRKGLRRKFRDSERHGAVTMELAPDIAPHLEAIHALYLQTHERSEFKFEELTPGYFLELARQMPDRTRYFLWWHKGRLVAFALCMVHDGVIYDLNVGMDYEVALDLHLYFITWRDVITWALEQGLERYETGPLNYDPKLHFKLDLAPLDLFARHLSWWINPIFGRALAYLQPARHDPVIARFPNAHEL